MSGERAQAWGVGQWESPAGKEAWEISRDEITRDIGAAMAALGNAGVARGDRVLFCSMLSEAGQFWPLMVATMAVGAQLSCADATEAEAARVAMFCGRLRYAAVIGITAEVVDGLAGLGVRPAELLGGVGIVAARPGAYERLASGGVPVHRFALVGPAVALGPAPGAPASVAASEWSVEDGPDGYLAVTNLKPRATTFSRTPTAIRGRVDEHGGIVPRGGYP